MSTRPPIESYQNVGGAWIHPGATLAPDVVVEPGAVVGDDVQVGAGTWIGSGAVLMSGTRIGVGNQIFPTAVLGGPPQDIGYAGEPTRLEIGDHNVIREGVTMHRASTKEDRATRVGSHNYFMANSHVGHDAVVGDHVVAANDVLIAGHCRVHSHANFAGGAAIVQFVTVGRYAFLGGLAGSRRDVEPFIYHDFPGGQGPEAAPQTLNTVGLKRAGFADEVIRDLRTTFKLLFPKTGPSEIEEVRAALARRGIAGAEVQELVDFCAAKRASRFGRAHSL